MKRKRFKMPGHTWRTYVNNKRDLGIHTRPDEVGESWLRVQILPDEVVFYCCNEPTMTRAEAIAFLEKALEKVRAAK